MSKHIKVNGKLLQVNKRYTNLKQKQQAKIAGWMYEAFKKQMNEKISDDEALNYVYDKIEKAEIWVPYYEVEKRYRDKKAKFKKRYESKEIPDGFKMDYDSAERHWSAKDKASAGMDEDELKKRIDEFIAAHNTCALATASKDLVRCTPIEYNYIDGVMYLLTEGGLKFRGLRKNKMVGIAIYEPYGGFGNLKSLQIEAHAHLIKPFSEEYNKVLEFKKIPVEAMQKLPQPLHLLKIYPESYDYLDSDLKKEGFEVRQHRGKYYN